MTNRFDFEQQIMRCWNVTDDIQDIYSYVCDGDIDKDKVANLLLGVKNLYELKFDKLMDMFEDSIKNWNYG